MFAEGLELPMRPVRCLRVPLLACSLATAATSWATTYYVSNAGADSAPGTSPSAPWATVARVNGTALHPGDTVLFACGSTWRETLSFRTSGTAIAPVTYAPYGACTSANKPTFSGADNLSAWIPELEGQTMLYAAPLFSPPARVFARNLHLLPAPAKSGLQPGSFFYDPALHRLYVRLEAGAAPSPSYPVEVAVRAAAGVGSGVSFLTIRNLVFNKAARNGLQFTGSLTNHRLEGVEAHNNVQGGISYQSNTGEAQNDVTIHGCRTSSNGLLGVYKGNGGARFVVEGCISGHDAWDPTQGQYTSAIRFVSDGTTDSNRVTFSAIRGNSVFQSGWDPVTEKITAKGDQEQGSGIWCDTCGNGTEVSGNIVNRSAHNGVEIEWTGATGPVYAINNLVMNSQSYGLLLSRRSHGAILANNTADNNFINCAVQGEFGGGEKAVGMVGNVFENNVCGSRVLNPAGTVAIFRWGGENAQTGEGSGNILRDNDFGDPTQTAGSWVVFGDGRKLTSYTDLDRAYIAGSSGHTAASIQTPFSTLHANPPATGYPDPALAGRLPPCLLAGSGLPIVGACRRTVPQP